MFYQDWSEFWWSSITGAHLAVTKVVDALSENSALIVQIPADMPWRQEMRSVIEDEFRKKTGYSEMIIEIIDASDECTEDESPGRFLLEKFAPNKEVRNGYRERSHKTIQEYIKEKSVLKNRVIWIKGFSEKQVGKWISFCKDYHSQSSENGLFVLEIRSEIPLQDSSEICSVRLFDCISGYDVLLLCSFIAEDIVGLSSEWKKYISTVASEICETDAEIASRLMEIMNIKKQAPLQIVSDLAELKSYSARGADKNSNHVFSLLRRGHIEKLERRLWRAQVKTLFPIIEMERIYVISCYQNELQKNLNENIIEQYNKRITNPFDVELGTLCYMMSNTIKNFCIKNKSIRDRIQFLHDCRNHLAHAHCCSLEEVQKLLDNLLIY